MSVATRLAPQIRPGQGLPRPRQVGPPPGSTSCAAVRRSNERSRIAGAVCRAALPMRHNPRVTNPDRLSGLDASFLALEERGAHMHVGSVLLFDGEAPAYEDFVAQLERRLALVPRYRQKLAFPPLVQSRPVWVDDPHFNAALPRAPHGAPAAGAARRELRAARRAHVRPAAGPLQAALGAVAGRPRRRRPLRDHRQDPSLPGRRHLRASTSRRCCSISTPTRPSRRPAEPGCRGPSRRGPRCSPTRCVERAAAPLGLARAAAAAATPPAGGGRRRRDGARRARGDDAGRAGRRAALAR